MNGREYAGIAVAVASVLVLPTFAQSWSIVFDGSYRPGTVAGPGQDLVVHADNPLDQSLRPNDGAQVPVSAPSYLHFEDGSSSSGQKWDEYRPASGTDMDYAWPDGGTVVFRVRRRAGAVGRGDINAMEFVIPGVERFFHVRFGPSAGSAPDMFLLLDPFYETGAYAGVDLTGWTVLRLAFAPEGGDLRVRVYAGGNTSPVIDTRAVLGSAGDAYWKMGSSSSGTGEYDLDWLLASDDGAFAPDAGPALPAGFDEGYAGPFQPTWTPAPPKPTPVLRNGGWESGENAPWVASVGPGLGERAPATSTFCGIRPRTGFFMSAHAANLSTAEGFYYQKTYGLPATDVTLTCWVATDCNGGNDAVRLGVDSTGGTDYLSETIRWSPALRAPGGNVWERKTFGPVPVTPFVPFTVWLHHAHVAGEWNITCIDDVALEASEIEPIPFTAVEHWRAYDADDR